jgi:hypothetical protein
MTQTRAALRREAVRIFVNVRRDQLGAVPP